ncbi:MAG: DUF1116 domain-containing protein [Victivallales bacterium]
MNVANKIAFEKLIGARPVLNGCGKAGELIPGFKKNLILHSGPPVEYCNMRGPHRMGVVGAALFEGLARNEKEAVGMIESGEIELGCANDYNSGGPGAGITSYSMAVLAVTEKCSGVRAFAAPIEGAQGGGLGGWGVYNREIGENLKAIEQVYAPLLDQALKAAGGISVADLFAEGLLMGDEEHTRQAATDKLFLSRLIEPLTECGCSDAERLALLRWLNSCRRFVHHVGCASAVASLKSASGIPGATMVTAMCGNGYEFGIKISGRGEQWHTAPAPTFQGRCFNPSDSLDDAAPWLGDSSNVEAWGLGGLAAAAGLALLAERSESPADGVAQCSEMAAICYGRNPLFRIPLLPEGCTPAGILPELAVRTGITPKMHGGILSRVTGGQIGVGYARTPLACFEKALR